MIKNEEENDIYTICSNLYFNKEKESDTIDIRKKIRNDILLKRKNNNKIKQMNIQRNNNINDGKLLLINLEQLKNIDHIYSNYKFDINDNESINKLSYLLNSSDVLLNKLALYSLNTFFDYILTINNSNDNSINGIQNIYIDNLLSFNIFSLFHKILTSNIRDNQIIYNIFLVLNKAISFPSSQNDAFYYYSIINELFVNVCTDIINNYNIPICIIKLIYSMIIGIMYEDNISNGFYLTSNFIPATHLFLINKKLTELGILREIFEVFYLCTFYINILDNKEKFDNLSKILSVVFVNGIVNFADSDILYSSIVGLNSLVLNNKFNEFDIVINSSLFSSFPRLFDIYYKSNEIIIDEIIEFIYFLSRKNNKKINDFLNKDQITIKLISNLIQKLNDSLYDKNSKYTYTMEDIIKILVNCSLDDKLSNLYVLKDEHLYGLLTKLPSFSPYLLKYCLTFIVVTIENLTQLETGDTIYFSLINFALSKLEQNRNLEEFILIFDLILVLIVKIKGKNEEFLREKLNEIKIIEMIYFFKNKIKEYKMKTFDFNGRLGGINENEIINAENKCKVIEEYMQKK